ncbi:MAG: S8 family serine peptidase, partial [Candidatus Lokiarchaeota archaeon]|nr:S8 family serine peptidase [Candidatus Lokiarchaeota archaeon]
MRKVFNKSLLVLLIILISSFLMLIPINNKINDIKNPNIKEIINLRGDTNQYNPNVIVFFENETYDASSIEEKFEYYGGNISGRWNGDFNSFSGFYGIMPLAENASNFENEIDLSSECHIEPNGIVQAQMNYASIQSGALNLSGYIGGYNGLNDSSIALLDTGIDDTHDFLSGKVEEDINFIDPGGESNDENGHGTFLSSVISGTGTYPFNSTNPIDLHISKEFSHSEIHGTGSESGNYSIKLATFNVSRADSTILLNSSWSLIDAGIDEVWFELWYDGELINYSFNEFEDINSVFTYQVPEENLGLYDFKVKYHKILNQNPSFSVDCVGQFFPEFYVSNYLYFSGIANDTKLLNYKVLNETAQGKMSDIISALSAVIQNRTIHKIVSVCLSLGTYETNVNALSQIIDEVTDNGILVVIAAGNYGIDDFETLNSLAQNNNAIVVGSINDRDQVSSFSSMGKEIGDNVIKPDIVAPGGSKLDQSRTILSANANTNLLTSNYGTSISAAIVSASINILIEAKWSDWATWDGPNIAEKIKILKNALFMTATETNQNREDDPNTEIIESQNRFSPSLYLEAINLTSRAGLKDIHEGYGRLNIDTAIDSLTKSISPSSEYNGFLSSSSENPLGSHAYARQVELVENRQYLFNLTDIEEGAVFDIYLYSNQSTQYGEPVLLESSRRSFGVYDYVYYTPKKNETNPYIVIKAINGEGNFTLNISEVENSHEPTLEIPEITYNGKSKNTTVLSLSEREGDQPKKNITLDRYKFYIEYFDNDTANVPPQGVYVCIPALSKNFSMSQSNIADQNYTDGAIFESEEIELPNNQTYNYYFHVRDGERQQYFPSESTYLTINISNPQVIKEFQYRHHFNDGLDNWTIVGSGWNVLQQSNQNDDRSNLYMNNWSAVYFGTHHYYPTNYSYQPTVMGEYSNGSFVSPYFDLTNLEDNINPVLEFGCRIS